jgi:hypothetical protein
LSSVSNIISYTALRLYKFPSIKKGKANFLFLNASNLNA